jgi:uncharacterized protein (TIGR02001 family)
MSDRSWRVTALAIAALLARSLALAQEPEPAAAVPDPEPAVAVSGNVTVASDYVFRGLTQTWGEPAVQGGIEFTFPAGFYAGVWGSNVSPDSYAGASLEADLYAGWTGTLGGFGLQLGALAYFFPGSDEDFDTVEVHGGLSRWGFELQLSYSVVDYLGLDRDIGYRDGSAGTYYLELNYERTFDSGFLVALHAAMTDVATELETPLGNGAFDPDYEDFLAKIGWDFDGPLAVTLAWSRATNQEFYDGRLSFLRPEEAIDPGEDRFVAALTFSR